MSPCEVCKDLRWSKVASIQDVCAAFRVGLFACQQVTCGIVDMLEVALDRASEGMRSQRAEVNVSSEFCFAVWNLCRWQDRAYADKYIDPKTAPAHIAVQVCCLRINRQKD